MRVGGNEVNDIIGGINANVTAETVFGKGSGVRENEAIVNEAIVQSEKFTILRHISLRFPVSLRGLPIFQHD